MEAVEVPPSVSGKRQPHDPKMKTHPSLQPRVARTPQFLVAAVIAAVFAGPPLVASMGTADPDIAPALAKLEAPSVPAMGPGETPVDPPTWHAYPAMESRVYPGEGLRQHPMVYIGEGCNTIFVVDQGKIVWTYATGKGWEYDDVWLLSNGNVLFTRMSYVAEVTPDKQVVWRHDCPKGHEVHTVQPLGPDRVLYVENGLPPRLRVVNTRTGATEVDHELEAKSATDAGTVHAQFRRARMTSAGTYLIPYLELGKVVEYDQAFRQVWSYAIASPWAAVRLRNGNTLITDERDALTREVNPQGQTVWEIKLSELPPHLIEGGSQSCARLHNGDTVLCSRGAGGQGCQLVEVNPRKEVVWALYDWRHLGPASGIQLLDEPGIPEHPGDLER